MVRQLDDAFSATVDVEFMGQETKRYNNPNKLDDPKNGKFCTLPTRVRFTDRASRFYFENTVRKLEGPKASQSWPKPIRAEMQALAKLVKDANPGKVVSVRVDTRDLSFSTWTKVDGERKWERVGGSYRIPPSVMLPNFKSDPEYYRSMMNAESMEY